MTELDSSVYPDLPEITPLCTDTCHSFLRESAEQLQYPPPMPMVVLGVDLCQFDSLQIASDFNTVSDDKVKLLSYYNKIRRVANRLC
ncbi:hypothetical protein J6590_061532 [Homalodisca vitripennis]|nr:hypothetical protein J6590_061532 [Homalodisca vitripennis]